MALNRVSNHVTQFGDCLALRRNGMTKSGRDVSTVYLVLCHFENDFTHETKIHLNENAASLLVLESVMPSYDMRAE